MLKMHINVDNFDRVYNVDEHVFELYTLRASAESENLGFVDRFSKTLRVSLEKTGVDLEIEQSLTSLSSTKETSSTGFACWKTTVLLADWILGHKECPFYSLFQERNELVVLELGTGIAGVCLSTLGLKCATYIATDQKHILKLLKKNFEDNAQPQKYCYSKGKKNKSLIHFIEYDWEKLEHGLANYESLDMGQRPDLIIACDTIYNEYLIPHFINACKQLMGPSTGVILGLQLRQADVMESFFQAVIDSGLKLYCIPESMLGNQLSRGFSVYYITL